MHLENWRYAKIRRGDIGRRNGAAAASQSGAGVPGDEKREHPSIALGTVYLPPFISSEGYGKKVSGAPTVAVYMDPL